MQALLRAISDSLSTKSRLVKPPPSLDQDAQIAELVVWMLIVFP
jgi:hypothetical protein